MVDVLYTVVKRKVEKTSTCCSCSHWIFYFDVIMQFESLAWWPEVRDDKKTRGWHTLKYCVVLGSSCRAPAWNNTEQAHQIYEPTLKLLKTVEMYYSITILIHTVLSVTMFFFFLKCKVTQQTRKWNVKVLIKVKVELGKCQAVHGTAVYLHLIDPWACRGWEPTTLGHRASLTSKLPSITFHVTSGTY